GEPLSLTRTVRLVEPLGPSSGVQVKTPVPALILAPAGAPTRLKVSVLAGRSGSVAVAVKVSKWPSSTVLLPRGPRTGGRFTSRTVTVMVSSANRLGEPLSVTRTLNG